MPARTPLFCTYIPTKSIKHVYKNLETGKQTDRHSAEFCQYPATLNLALFFLVCDTSYAIPFKDNLTYELGHLSCLTTAWPSTSRVQQGRRGQTDVYSDYVTVHTISVETLTLFSRLQQQKKCVTSLVTMSTDTTHRCYSRSFEDFYWIHWITDIERHPIFHKIS